MCSGREIIMSMQQINPTPVVRLLAEKVPFVGSAVNELPNFVKISCRFPILILTLSQEP